MRRDTRAVIFDLDDTLYPYRRFRLSGFATIARHLSSRAGLDPRLGFAALTHASRGMNRGRELQTCLAQHDLPATWLGELIDVLRHHEPSLKLPASSRRTLQALRDDGWRVGVLTNGPRSIQARKVEALGLAPLVDVVGYATAIGTGRGKPDPDAFAWMARALAVPAARAVFVGDDESCDVRGAAAAGMVPVRCVAWTPLGAEPTEARSIVHRLTDVPAVATSLIEEAPNRHAA